MRTVFLGTSEFASTVLAQLAQGPHRPALVVTRPDRPRGRGRRLSAPPVADTARAHALDLAQPERVNDPGTLATIEHAARPASTDEPPVLVVCAFGALIKEPLLSAYTPLNVHPSLLPRWRGAAPVERAMMAGDTQTGVSIMRLTAGLDSGPVCRTHTEAIEPADTYGTLAPRLAQLGGQLLVDVLDAFARGAPPSFVKQDDRHATYAEKIAPADRLLDPGRPAAELERVVRALHPHVGARLAVGEGEPLRVLRARVADAAGGAGAGEAGAGGVVGGPAAGELAALEGRLLFGARDSALELLEVQPPGGRPMDAAAYLRGYGLPRT